MRTFVLSVIVALPVFMLLNLTPRTAEAKCTVCHSKNPKMVRMHEELGLKDCFKCHFKGRIAAPREMPRQMRTDPLCKDCHATGPLPDPMQLKNASSTRHGPIP